MGILENHCRKCLNCERVIDKKLNNRSIFIHYYLIAALNCSIFFLSFVGFKPDSSLSFQV